MQRADRSFSPTPSSPASHAARRTSARCGFTLVETMVAATIFAMLMIGVYTMLLKSYQLIALTRVRDDARAVLRTFADQFERLSTTQQVDDVVRQRWLFLPTNGPTGRGLVWGALSDQNTSVNAEDVPYLPVPLGGESHRVNATLTRDVRYVDASSGSDAASREIEAAGYMLSATFTINYSMAGKDYTQSLTVLRTAP